MNSILKQHAEAGGKLSVTTFTAHSDSDEIEQWQEDYVKIRGTSDSLRFLGEILISFANGDHGCSFAFHTQGAGNAHFTSDSDPGILLLKEPCEPTAAE